MSVYGAQIMDRAGQEGQHGVVLPILLYVVRRGVGANFCVERVSGEKGKKRKGGLPKGPDGI